MLKRISINVHSSTQQITLQIWCLLKVRTGWLYSLINLDFFVCVFSLKVHYYIAHHIETHFSD